MYKNKKITEKSCKNGENYYFHEFLNYEPVGSGLATPLLLLFELQNK